jgi:hypothetical protein
MEKLGWKRMDFTDKNCDSTNKHDDLANEQWGFKWIQ